MKNIDELKDYLITTFPDSEIFLFGSRAKSAAKSYSDIDIAIKSDRDLFFDITKAKYEIEESQIPYKVDLIDLSKAPYLDKIVAEEGIKWH